jgi:ATP-binding cassette, subfamily C (CFTR/MRP), member 1
MFALAQAIFKQQDLNSPPPSLLIENAQQLRYPKKFMPIILLNKAPSSLDPETEAVIYHIIHEEFTEKGHIIIAITHRLGGVTKGLRAGQDMIVSLSKGRVEKITGVEGLRDG